MPLPPAARTSSSLPGAPGVVGIATISARLGGVDLALSQA